VQADSLSQAADELYGLPPADFTGARDTRAREAKAAGDGDAAAQIKKLAKPTVSAWLVNQLMRDAADQMRQLFDLGQALQDAQRELDGDRMRELSAQRRQVIGALVPEATRIATQAGQPASAAVLTEVRATLEATLADPAAVEAVRSGRLTKGLAYAGLGEVGPGAVAAARPRGQSGSGRGKPAGRESAVPAAADAVERAQQAVNAAQADAATAEAAVGESEQRLATVAEQRQFVRRRIERLEQELREAQAEDGRLGRDSRQARSQLDAAVKKRTVAQRRLAAAVNRMPPG
jgi:hypothetical protein